MLQGLKIKKVSSIKEIVQDYSSPFGGLFGRGSGDGEAKRWQRSMPIPTEGGSLQLHLDEEEEPTSPTTVGPSAAAVAAKIKRKPAPRLMPLPKGWSQLDWTPEGLVFQRQKEWNLHQWPERLRLAYEKVALDEGEHIGKVPKIQADTLLEAAGHTYVWKNLVTQYAHAITHDNALTVAQVYELFKRYEAKVVEGLERAFRRRCRLNGSEMPYHRLHELVSQQGFTPLPQTMLDILVEAVELIDQRGGVACSEDLLRAMGQTLPSPSASPSRRAQTLSGTDFGSLTTGKMSGTIHELSATLPGAIEEDESAEDDIPWGVFYVFCELLVNREGFSKRESLEFELVFRHFDQDRSGVIEATEWAAILSWLGFLSGESVAGNLSDLLSDVAGDEGLIDLDKFHTLMRSHRSFEYAYTVELFGTYDTSGNALLEPSELFLLFKKLGLSVLPEALAEMVEDAQVPHQGFSFTSFWKILQIVRHRDGFSATDRQEISLTFDSFDPSRSGKMVTRFVPYALRWLGYLLGSDLVERVPWRQECMNDYTITEQSFTKIVRKHAEADLRSTRMIFREYAEHRGGGPIRGVARLSSALARLCPQYIEIAAPWLAEKMPDKVLENADKATFDFEEFVRIARGCRLMLRKKLRENNGFSEARLKKLKSSFSLLVKECGRPTLPPSALIELFRYITPAVETSKEMRDMLKEALVKHRCQTTGMDMEMFMHVMRSFEDLIEGQCATSSPFVAESLGLKAMQVDEVLDVYIKYVFGGVDSLSDKDLLLIFEGQSILGKSPDLNKLNPAKYVDGDAKGEDDAEGDFRPVPSANSSPYAFDALDKASKAASALVASRQGPSEAQVVKWKQAMVDLQAKNGLCGTVVRFVQFVQELRGVHISQPVDPNAPKVVEPTAKFREPVTPSTAGPASLENSRPTTKSESRPNTSDNRKVGVHILEETPEPPKPTRRPPKRAMTAWG